MDSHQSRHGTDSRELRLQIHLQISTVQGCFRREAENCDRKRSLQEGNLAEDSHLVENALISVRNTQVLASKK